MSELDMLRVGDTDESLVVLMEKAGEVVSGSCWLLDIDTGDGVSNWVVSWSTRWVYLVRPDRPKFLTCMTFGSTVLSNLSSRVAAELSRLRMPS